MRKNSIVDVAATMGILGDLFPKYKKPRAKAKAKRNPINRWGVKFMKGDVIEYRTARGGRETGTVAARETTGAYANAYGKRVILDSGISLAYDDVVSVVKPRAKAKAKRNPASGVRIVHNKLLGGGRFASREAAQQYLIDAKNRRDDRSPKYRRNPASGSHRSTATGPHWLVYESRNGGRTWLKIARFDSANKGEHHAKEYARALYRKNPHLGYSARVEK